MRPTETSEYPSLKMILLAVPLLCAIIPWIAVHLALTVSIAFNHFDPCFPYIDGCVTISHAARSGDSLFIFRALMLPSATLFFLFWLLAFIWLRCFDPSATRGMKVMRALGTSGALFLVLYVTFLGSEGEFYRWMRRYGVTFFFSFTALSQIFLTQRLFQLHHHTALKGMTRWLRVMLGLCVAQWTIGLLSLGTDFVFEDSHTQKQVQNIVEWNFALAMNAYFFVAWWVMRCTGFEGSASLNRN